MYEHNLQCRVRVPSIWVCASVSERSLDTAKPRYRLSHHDAAYDRQEAASGALASQCWVSPVACSPSRSQPPVLVKRLVAGIVGSTKVIGMRLAVISSITQPFLRSSAAI